MLQRTLRNSIKASGAGLHTGRKVTICLQPAEPDTGIVFQCMDNPGSKPMRALTEAVSDTNLATTIGPPDQSVATIEHLMATFCAFGIDNCLVEVTGNEVPIMDGSAGPFVFLLKSAGIVEQNAPKKFIRIRKKVRVQDGEKWAELRPEQGFSLDYRIDFNHPVIRASTSRYHFDFSSMAFIKEISRSRTFGFLDDIETMREKGRALGGSIENAIVLDPYRLLNPHGLRDRDEFVKHKVLDAIGDLYLIGHPLIGHYSGYKSGHSLNHKLLHKLMQEEKAWEPVVFKEKAGTKEIQFFPIDGIPVY